MTNIRIFNITTGCRLFCPIVICVLYVYGADFRPYLSKYIVMIIMNTGFWVMLLSQTKPNFLFQLLIITRCEMTMLCTGEAAYVITPQNFTKTHQYWEIKHHSNLLVKAPIRTIFYVCFELH